MQYEEQITCNDKYYIKTNMKKGILYTYIKELIIILYDI